MLQYNIALWPPGLEKEPFLHHLLKFQESWGHPVLWREAIPYSKEQNKVQFMWNLSSQLQTNAVHVCFSSEGKVPCYP